MRGEDDRVRYLVFEAISAGADPVRWELIGDHMAESTNEAAKLAADGLPPGSHRLRVVQFEDVAPVVVTVTRKVTVSSGGGE